MNSPPPNLPRFLPTLTEVVFPTGSSAGSEPAEPAPQDITASVMQRVDKVMERRLREANALTHTLLTEQLENLRSSLRQELETVVREAVAAAVASRGDAQ